MSDLSPIRTDTAAPADFLVTIEVHELRTLLRIATELRDPRWRDMLWIQNLAAKCGLTIHEVQ